MQSSAQSPDPIFQYSETISFERDAESPAPAAVLSCHRCTMVLTEEEYYTVDGKATCDYCAQKIRDERRKAAARKPKSPISGSTQGIALAAAAAFVGAVAYAGIMILTHIEIGFMAAGLGWFIGYSAYKGAGKSSRTMQWISVVLTYMSMCLAGLAVGLYEIYVHVTPQLQKTLAMLTQLGAGQIATVSLMSLIFWAVIYPFAGGLITLLFFGIGMFQAWRQAGKREEFVDPNLIRDAGFVRVRQKS